MNTTTQIKGPVLLNLDSMSLAAGAFHIPGEMLAAHLKLGDVVTVRAFVSTRLSEPLAVSLSGVNGVILTGTVITATIFAEKHGVRHGDVIRLCADAIYNIEEMD